ncbi:MAG: FmdE family protein [Methanobacterium sp.]|nr:FmdE family protein [Methanobacterium sp.]
MNDIDKNKKKITSFSEVTKFHGHACPGIAIGYRVAESALEKLSSVKALDEEFVAIVENDSCSVDAIQVTAGCTMGKGNLIFKDHGKQVYTFINRNTGEALRISLSKGFDEIDPSFFKVREKAFSDSSTEEDIIEFEKIKEEMIKKILEMPLDELFTIENTEMEIPLKASIYKSFKCAECGEPVSEHRARVKNGAIVCIPCFEFNFS